MWKFLTNLFCAVPPEQMRERGRQVAKTAIENARNPSDEAAHLYALADGGFNTTDGQRAFDAGVREQLLAMGYESSL